MSNMLPRFVTSSHQLLLVLLGGEFTGWTQQCQAPQFGQHAEILLLKVPFLAACRVMFRLTKTPGDSGDSRFQPYCASHEAG